MARVMRLLRIEQMKGGASYGKGDAVCGITGGAIFVTHTKNPLKIGVGLALVYSMSFDKAGLGCGVLKPGSLGTDFVKSEVVWELGKVFGPSRSKDFLY